MERRDAARTVGEELKTIDHFRKDGKRKRSRRPQQQKQKQQARRPRTWAEHKAQTIEARRERALRIYGSTAPSSSATTTRRGKGTPHKRRMTEAAKSKHKAGGSSSSKYSKLPAVGIGTVDTQIKIQTTADSTRKVALQAWNSDPLYCAMQQEDYEITLPRLEQLSPVHNAQFSVARSRTWPGQTNARQY